MTDTVMEAQNTELHSILENFVEHENDFPVRGNNRNERQLQNMWRLGFVDGASTAIQVVVNRMCKPGSKPYEVELVRSSVVIPLMLGSDITEAERKVQELIAKTWAT